MATARICGLEMRARMGSAGSSSASSMPSSLVLESSGTVSMTRIIAGTKATPMQMKGVMKPPMEKRMPPMVGPIM